MPAFRNIGPSRRSESFDHGQEHFQHKQSSDLGSSSIPTGCSSFPPRVIYTPGPELSGSDSTPSGPSSIRQARLVLHGPRADGDRETNRRGSSPSVAPALHTPPSPTFPDNSKRRRISASLYTSTPPLLVSQEASRPSDIARKPTTPFRPSRPRKKDKDYIPRPKNAFILFRSEFYQKFTQAAAEESLRNLDQANISQQAAWKWNTLNEDEKKPYMAWAAAEKEAHAVMYPGYSFARDKKSKSPRKRSKTLKRKAPDDIGDGIEPSSEASSQHHLQSSLVPPPSPSLGFFLRPASWGGQGADEPGSRMNPITESSSYMNLSDEEAPEDSEAIRAKYTSITEPQPTQRSQPTSTLPTNPARNHGSEPSLRQRTLVLVKVNSHIGGKQLPEPEVNAIEGSGSVPLKLGGITDTQHPHILRTARGHPKPPTSSQSNEQSVDRSRAAPSTTTLGEPTPNMPGNVALVGSKVLEAVNKGSRHTADRANKQLTYQPVTMPTATASNAQHFEAGAAESPDAIRERPTAASVNFNPPRLVEQPSLASVPLPIYEGVERGLNTPSHSERRPQFVMRHSGMSRPVPPSMSAEERKRRFATSRFRVTSEEPPLAPPAMSAAECKRRFATSRFRVMSEEPPTMPPIMSPDERRRRFATSRFRVMSEEPSPPAMTSAERNRRFATSRFRVMPEESTLPPSMSTIERKRRFATSRFHVMPEDPQISLLRRTSRFLNGRMGRPNKPTSPQKFQPPAIPDRFDLGSTSAALPSPFPPLQFTPGNIPEVYSVRILGLNFMAC